MNRSPNQYQIQYVAGSMLGSGRKMAKATYQSVIQILQGYTVLFQGLLFCKGKDGQIFMSRPLTTYHCMLAYNSRMVEI